MTPSPGRGYARLEPWLVLFAVGGLVAVTLSGQGTYKPFVYLTELLVLVRVGRALAVRRCVRPAAVWLVLAPGIFILNDVLVADGHSDKHAVQNLVAFVAVTAAVWTLPARWPRGRRMFAIILAALAVISVAHAVTLWLYLEPHGPMANPQLLSHNPHFIALQAAVAVPVLGAGLWFGGIGRWLSGVGIAAAVISLGLLGSIIGVLSLGAAAAALAVVYLPVWLRKACLVAAGAVLLAVVVYPAMPEAYDGPLAWARQETGASRLDERFDIWAESWQLQAQASAGHWWLGHGLGGFEADFPRVWVFPHHFGLEVLYNSGIVGLVAFSAALAALGRALARGIGRGRGTVLVAFALLVSVGLFTFLTLPLTARVTTHALGVAVGLSLWALKREAAEAG